MFRRVVITGTIGAALFLTVAVAGYGRATASKTLQGTVGPGYTISLKMNGKPVKTLGAGAYTFVVADKSSAHGFTLEKEKGGKFEKALTPVGFVGKKTVKVKLTAGKWKIYCPPHESMMYAFFTVK